MVTYQEMNNRIYLFRLSTNDMEKNYKFRQKQNEKP